MKTLDPSQIEQLTRLFQHGASDASHALSLWLSRKASVSIEQLEQLSFEQATESLGPADTTLCGCIMGVTGGMTGYMLFCFDDASGLSLCDLLLERSIASEEWGELETSSAMETANIVGCAYLNSLAEEFPRVGAADPEKIVDATQTWVPTPPQFIRDYAASILEFAVMSQATEFDSVLVAKNKFQIDDQPVAWTLLLIPDASSLDSMRRMLG